MEATREKREEAGFAGGGEHGERRRREPDSDAGRLRGSDLRRVRHARRGAGEFVSFSNACLVVVFRGHVCGVCGSISSNVMDCVPAFFRLDL